MTGTFKMVGKIAPANSKKSFKVYQLQKNGSWLFTGLVTRKALSYLITGRIRQADICVFSSKTEDLTE
ncbi:MAG: hypothetical protein IAX22_02605 [Candidatus Bathyarchaeota archaeon]|nr:hypothetical protein [Candidatus Bathyarchaeota archaeon]